MMSTGDQGLVVPMRVAAMPVGSGDATKAIFQTAFADFTALGEPGAGNPYTPYVGACVLATMANATQTVAPGIHLHWNLPRALRHGESGRDGTLTMPAAPNRWMVTRIQWPADNTAPNAGLPLLTSWLIQSDVVNDDGSMYTACIPGAPDSGSLYGGMGTATAFTGDSMPDGTPALSKPLTAMGYGIPSFSSFLPNCYNVFGFLDTDVTRIAGSNTFTYVVTGWYSDRSLDPIASLKDGKLSGTKNGFGWLFDAKDPPPTCTLVSGVVADLTYDYAGTYQPDIQPSTLPTIAASVAIGNTPMEALSALSGSLAADVQGAELLLNAVQTGLLPTLGSPGATQAVVTATQAATFNGHHGGTTWEVVPVRQTAGLEPGPVIPNSGMVNVADTLAKLNAAQKQLDQAQDQLATLHQQYFADWCAFQNLKHWPQFEPKPDVDAQQVLDNLLLTTTPRAIELVTQRIANLTQTVASLKRSLEVAMGTGPMHLKHSPAQRHHEPQDLILLFAGAPELALPPDVTAPTVECLLTSQLPLTLELAADFDGYTNTQILVTSDQMPSPFTATLLPSTAIGSLVQVGMFVDPLGAATVTGLLGAQQDIPFNPASSNADPTGVQTAVTQAMTNLFNGTALSQISTVLTLSAAPQGLIALTTGNSGVNPVALAWTGTYTPLRDTLANSYDETFVTKNFIWSDDGLDLTLSATATLSDQTSSITGWVPLNAGATLNLQRQIRNCLKHNPAQQNATALETLLESLGNVPLLAQGIAGFHDTLAQKSGILQLPIADPYDTTPDYQEKVKTLQGPQGVQGRKSLNPTPDSVYSPLRAGSVSLQNVILVDEFGRMFSIVAAQSKNSSGNVIVSQPVSVAASIPVQTSQPQGAYGYPLLPPLRLTQPSRLNAQWLSAGRAGVAASNLPGADPICGWLVANNVDQSLMFYNRDGTGVGILLGAGPAPVWMPWPTVSAGNIGGEPVNSVLHSFITTLRGQTDTTYIQGLLETIDAAQATFVPGMAPSNAMSVLMSTPLALTQASLAIELMGLPTPDQSYHALKQVAQPDADAMRRETRQLESVHLPIRLGDAANLQDGLVGFFLEDGTAGVDFSTFYTDAVAGDLAAITRQKLGTLTTRIGAPARTVTMLLDPRGSVNVAHGLGPARSLSIPPAQYEKVLANLSCMFLATPILQAGTPVPIPVPTELKGTWTWLSNVGGTWQSSATAAVNQKAGMQTPSQIVDGWLRFSRKPQS